MESRVALLYRGGLACSFILAASATTAQIVQTAPMHYACNSAAGKFVREPIDDLVPGDVLRARVRMISNANDGRWASGAGLRFILGDDSQAAVTVVSSTDPEHLFVTMRVPGNTGPNIVSSAKVGTWIEITAKLDSNGTLTAWGGDKSKALKFPPGTVVRREVHCQSGSWEIELLSTQSRH